jgi:hypothetical protein
MTALATTPTPAPTISPEVLEKVIIKGDLSALSVGDRTQYYLHLCNTLGLNPATQPFAYIVLNGKLTLYALKNCTDQLRNIYNISVTDLTEVERADGVYVVTAKVRNGAGRTDVARGAVNISNLKGEYLANALMKTETKAKRRATLSICGLGMLDETEIEDIPGAREPPREVKAVPATDAPRASRLPPRATPARTSSATASEAGGGLEIWDDAPPDAPPAEAGGRTSFQQVEPPPAPEEGAAEEYGVGEWLQDVAAQCEAADSLEALQAVRLRWIEPYKQELDDAVFDEAVAIWKQAYDTQAYVAQKPGQQLDHEAYARRDRLYRTMRTWETPNDFLRYGKSDFQAELAKLPPKLKKEVETAYLAFQKKQFGKAED